MTIDSAGEPLRLLLCHNRYRQRGGEDGVFDLECRILEEHGHRLEIYTRDSNEMAELSLMGRARMAAAAFFSWRTYRDISAIVRRFRPHAALVQNVFPLVSPAAYWALSRRHVPIVQLVFNYRLTGCSNAELFTQGHRCERCLDGPTLWAARFRCLHGNLSQSLLYAAVLGLHRRLGTFRRIDRFVVPHSFVGEKLVQVGLPAARMRTNPNPFRLPPPSSLEDQPPYLLYLGRVVQPKGVLTLVHAMERVRSGIRLVLAGDGSALPQLQQLLSERPALKKRVHLPGAVWGAEAERLLQGAAAVVVPSEWYDVSPTVLYDALARGKPVIVSRLGTFPEIVEDDVDGLLFEEGNPEALAAAIDRLAGDPQLRRRLGAAGSERARLRFSPETHYQRLRAVLEELTQRST